MRSHRSMLGITFACLWLLPGAAGAESNTQTVQVSATILPRLELSVAPETGSSIAFGALTQPADGDAASRSVNVSLNVFSNLGRPYHVTQTIRQPLTNAQGRMIPPEQLQVTTRSAVHGTPGAANPVALIPGVPMTLYTSDAGGTSAEFSADYALKVTPTTPTGTFQTEILYTVTSL